MSHSLMVRALRLVNIAIAVIAAVVLGALYWFAWRPLPQRSGTVAAPVAAATTVSFDALGEPHIRAASLDDALFTQGYVTAQDRLWQMDALRRYAAGDLAEILGPTLLESDRESRGLRMRRIAEQAYTTLAAADRTAFAAYARGVNFFIATHLDDLPVEFSLLRYQPRPWSVVDSILICLHMFRDLTTTWRNKVVKRDLLQGGDARLVDFLFPVRVAATPLPGSNAWAIAGRLTASGKPLLSNDMHLGYTLPGIWLMAHLEAPGLDVAGVALPGVPGVVVGHNQRIAWGITNLHYDSQDLYIEKLDERTGRYLFRGQVEMAAAEREIIPVKGGKPAELIVWVTRHGPVIATSGGQPLALAWTAALPGIVQYPFLDIDRAQNWQQFTAALERFPGPGSNFVYADVDGNIGYHAAGKLPIRRTFPGDVPVDGSSGNFEWDGLIPFQDLPSAFNPPGGIIATANQNPFPADYKYPVNGNFAPPDRVRQIRNRLQSRTGWRAQDMLSIQKDVYSAFLHFVAQQTVAAYDKRNQRNPSLDSAIALLRNWNGQMETRLAAPFLATLIYQHVRTSMVEAASPGKSPLYDLPIASAVVETLLRVRPAGWFRDYDALLLRALVDAVDEGTRMQGHDVKRWQYGAFSRIFITHPVIHQVTTSPLLRWIPGVADHFDIGPLPMSGSPTTVKQFTPKLAPSMRMNADLSDWDRSLLNLQIGQSGQIFSSHYRDQWQAYYDGRSFPMQYHKVEVKSTLVFRPEKPGAGGGGRGPRD
jgi:penicillin G amidase